MLRVLVVMLLVVIVKQDMAQHGIEVKNAWMRPGVKGMNSALYLEIKNNQDLSDTLYAVKSEIAKINELHETYQKGDMMGMRKVEFIVIKPHSSFMFEPGGHHIMLISLQKDLKQGNKGIVLLQFKRAGEVKLTAEIKK